jgi:hypothetical protein
LNVYSGFGRRTGKSGVAGGAGREKLRLQR